MNYCDVFCNWNKTEIGSVNSNINYCGSIYSEKIISNDKQYYSYNNENVIPKLKWERQDWIQINLLS